MAIQGGHAEIITADQVAVMVTKGGMQHHAALLFRDKAGSLIVLHLLNHKKLRSEPYPGMRAFGAQYCWVAVVLNLPIATSKSLVGNLRKIAKRQGDKLDSQIPYGVKVLENHGSFTKNGDYVKPRNSNGLTCATFVTEVVGSIGYRILRESTWPEGVNADWIAAVAAMLRNVGADETHVREVESCVNARRICPADVMIGSDAGFKSWPRTFQDVAPLLPSVEAALKQHCGGVQAAVAVEVGPAQG